MSKRDPFELLYWRHGSLIKIRKVVTGGYYAQNPKGGYIPFDVRYSVTVWNGIKIRSDSGLRLQTARRHAERIARDMLTRA